MCVAYSGLSLTPAQLFYPLFCLPLLLGFPWIMRVLGRGMEHARRGSRVFFAAFTLPSVLIGALLLGFFLLPLLGFDPMGSGIVPRAFFSLSRILPLLAILPLIIVETLCLIVVLSLLHARMEGEHLPMRAMGRNLLEAFSPVLLFVFFLNLPAILQLVRMAPVFLSREMRFGENPLDPILGPLVTGSMWAVPFLALFLLPVPLAVVTKRATFGEAFSKTVHLYCRRPWESVGFVVCSTALMTVLLAGWCLVPWGRIIGGVSGRIVFGVCLFTLFVLFSCVLVLGFLSLLRETREA
jgi:hypothetical protein